MNKLYHEEMEACPCQQGLRCSMNGGFCKEKNCGPLFIIHQEKLKRLIDKKTITDGFGNYWDAHCPRCGKRRMAVVRPGEAVCQHCAIFNTATPS